MQTRILVLTLSLAANAALAFLLLRTDSTHPKSEYTAAGSSRPASEAGARQPSRADASDPVASAITRAPTGPDLWSQLFSADLDQLATRLKAAGFSFREIRAILLPLAQQRFQQLRTEVMGPQDSAPYWHPTSPHSMPEDPAQRARLSELMYNESKLYRKHFYGSDALAQDADARRQAVHQFGNLPTEKLQRLAQIQQDYQELQHEIYIAAQKRPRGDLTADEKKQLQLLQAEEQRDFQQALTPEEYTEYLYRSSPTAQQLRQQLSLFQPSESEYKTLFALLHPINEQFSQPGYDENTYKARFEAMKNLQPQIEAALGPERYADYKQAAENGNDKVTRLIARLELPLRTVGQINTLREDITTRAEAIRKDPQLSAADRDAQLAGLAQEARIQLSNTLGGPRGFDAYNDMKGDWLRALDPKPATP